MRILLTNDDGVFSPGLEALRTVLSRDHEVWVCAPDGERSGMSHYITIKGPVAVKEISERVMACSGSPADCVIVAVLSGNPGPPDIVLSGINIGPNLGTDIIYSGTAAAARQAALMGFPGVALSVDGFSDPLYFDPLAEFVEEHLEDLCALWNPHHFINVNAPNSPRPIERVEITHPCRRIYNDRLHEFRAPRGETYYFMAGYPVENGLMPGTDWHALSHGSLSISPIGIDPVNHHDDEAYRRALFVKSGV
ncbi:MAG: 5'/3'-nucleotidase SurE [Spirochaetaceae bacterium]|nr:MAG: 5'/3'-nucleotidase SurE [Spirochaetaceae bacterium]